MLIDFGQIVIEAIMCTTQSHFNPVLETTRTAQWK